MKKVLGLIIISAVLASPVFAAMPDSFSVNGKAMIEYSKGLAGPLPATDVKLVKKTPLPFIDVEMKGNPTAQSQGKKPSGQAATGLLGAGPASAKYAIVIGICDYPGTSNDICWADGDSMNMYNALVDVYGYDPANIRLFRDMGDHPEILGERPAIFDEIVQAINEIKGVADADDEVVFFFSGHGGDGIAQDSDKEARDEAIIVHNGFDKLVYIWDGYLRDTLFAGFATTRIAFVFDSCLSGGMKDVASAGRVVSMASGETQLAYVYSTGNSPFEPGEDKLGEGVFSHYFVNDGMLQGLADKYNHDKDAILLEGNDVVIEEAFDYAGVNIPKFLQTPTISDLFANDLLL